MALLRALAMVRLSQLVVKAFSPELISNMRRAGLAESSLIPGAGLPKDARTDSDERLTKEFVRAVTSNAPGLTKGLSNRLGGVLDDEAMLGLAAGVVLQTALPMIARR